MPGAKWTQWLRLPAAIGLALVVFGPAGALSQAIGSQIPQDWPSKEWLTTSAFQILMLCIAVLLMLVIGRGRLRRFGFQRGSRFPWWPVLRAVFVVEVLVSLATLPLRGEGPGHFAGDFAFWQIVVGVWIIASTCEEVVTRGLIQSFLDPLRGHAVRVVRLHLSVPVITGAVFFSAMHVPLLVMGIDTGLGIQILVSTFALGIIAGYYREQTVSLIPAILAHMLANIVGMGLGSMLDLFK